jgi:hypothetical protein
LASENNAWCITCELREGAEAATPLIFTRNFVGGSTLDSIKGLSSTELSAFRGWFGVVVTFGGSVRVIRDTDFHGDPEHLQQQFNPNGSKHPFIRP